MIRWCRSAVTMLRQLVNGSLLLLAIHAAAPAQSQLNHVATHALPQGTHRPEILALPDGGVLVVVVQPEGPPVAGASKHKAYRLDANWNPIGAPYVVTRVTDEFGEPADHRAAIVNGELVVFYQSLIFSVAPPANGPAETVAREQSLMMARFTLDGHELDRRPILAHQTDFSQENFPDFCILWQNGRFLAGTGSLFRTFKIREVDLQGNVLATHVLQTSPNGIGGTLGNSFYHDGSRLFVFSATSPDDGGLTVTELDAAFQPVTTLRMSDPSREENFPVGNLLDNGSLYITYISRLRGGPNDLLGNPFSPYLKFLDTDFQTLQDLELGQGGFSHVHLTIVRSGKRLLVAWSEAVDLGSFQAPQIHIEEFELTDPSADPQFARLDREEYLH